jgi:hypothetical protein
MIKINLVNLAHFYPKDFSKLEFPKLPYHLDMFVAGMHRDEIFKKVKNTANLSVMHVEAK